MTIMTMILMVPGAAISEFCVYGPISCRFLLQWVEEGSQQKEEK